MPGKPATKAEIEAALKALKARFGKTDPKELAASEAKRRKGEIARDRLQHRIQDKRGAYAQGFRDQLTKLAQEDSAAPTLAGLSPIAGVPLASTAYGAGVLGAKPKPASISQYKQLLRQFDPEQYGKILAAPAQPFAPERLQRLSYFFDPYGEISGAKGPSVLIPGKTADPVTSSLEKGLRRAGLGGSTKAYRPLPDLGMLAHELGHSQQQLLWKNKMLARAAIAGMKGAPAVAGLAAAALDDEDKARLAVGAGTAAATPMLAAEVDASRRGYQALKNVKGLSGMQRLRPFAGVPTYAGVASIPLLAYLLKKKMGGYKGDE
jgi:hypothetical protein